jgi:hypothetical protein
MSIKLNRRRIETLIAAWWRSRRRRSASPCHEQTTLGAKYVALDRFSLVAVYRLVPRRKEIRG